MASAYPIVNFVPGPVSVPARILEAMCHDYDSGHIESDFLGDYQKTSAKLGQLLGTQNDVLQMSGEAMAILWGALKSCLRYGDKLLCIDTGVFGAGFADMGKSIGCEVQSVSFEADSTINNAQALQRIEDSIKKFKPKMITAVHCETPSGTLNPLGGLGELKKLHQVPLLVVDAVASVGAVPVAGDNCHVDIVMGGSQKALSAPPCMVLHRFRPVLGRQ